MKTIRVEWMDRADVTYYALDHGYSPEEKVIWISTENQPALGDRKTFQIPLCNVRIVEVSR